MAVASLPPPLFLVIDDDEVLRESVGDVLRDAGYRVFASPGGRQALEALLKGLRPACIVVELMMPGMDGWQFCRELHERHDLRELPVIILTAIEPHWGYPTAASCVLRKPLDALKLLDCVSKVLEKGA